jgi:predicted SpoU family rRNA methylase
MRPMLYVFGFVAVAVSLDTILSGGWYTQTFSNAELSILKSIYGFFTK